MCHRDKNFVLVGEDFLNLVHDYISISKVQVNVPLPIAYPVLL
jgi:hypothetical protein